MHIKWGKNINHFIQQFQNLKYIFLFVFLWYTISCKYWHHRKRFVSTYNWVLGHVLQGLHTVPVCRGTAQGIYVICCRVAEQKMYSFSLSPNIFPLIIFWVKKSHDIMLWRLLIYMKVSLDINYVSNKYCGVSIKTNSCVQNKRLSVEQLFGPSMRYIHITFNGFRHSVKVPLPL